MQPPPISQTEIEARLDGHLDELLDLWKAEQGGTRKVRALQLMASALPFPRAHAIKVLDLCCGPGDVGRAIHREYSNAHIDCVDRDPFLAAICKGVNRRQGIAGTITVRDVKDADWNADVSTGYDVVATANALHQFNVTSAERLLQEVHRLLRIGGVFLLAEPVSAEAPFARGFEAWKDELPARYTRENWERLWSTANAIVGYNPVTLWPRDANRIDAGMTVAGFDLNDVLLRDADEVIIASMK